MQLVRNIFAVAFASNFGTPICKQCWWIYNNTVSFKNWTFSKLLFGISIKAPLAIYCKGNALLKQSHLAQAAHIAVMNVFQQIYWPEIYCSTLPAGSIYIPNIENKYFEPTSFTYDREERDQILSINHAFSWKKIFLIKMQ